MKRKLTVDIQKADWLTDEYVKNWFENIKAPRTIRNYTREFPFFLEFVKKTPTEIIESRIEHLTSKDMSKRRYWELAVIKFTRHLETLTNDEGKRRLGVWGIHGYQRAIQSFFSHNGLKLAFARKELDVEPAEREKIQKEFIPSNEHIRVLYRGCNTARDRAILLTLYQSGFSESDVSNMKIEDFPFYDKDGNWQLEPFKDLYHARLREKTNILQQTCISREAIEDIRIMLQNRGYPRKGYLFISHKKEQFTPRFINDMLKGLVKNTFPDKATLWKTKHLRDAFMNGLLQAKIPGELKDSMVGHKRSGAKSFYGLTEETIKQTYDSAFKFLTVNGVGSTSRKLEQVEKDFTLKYGELGENIAELRHIIKEQNQLIRTITVDIIELLPYTNAPEKMKNKLKGKIAKIQ